MNDDDYDIFDADAMRRAEAAIVGDIDDADPLLEADAATTTTTTNSTTIYSTKILTLSAIKRASFTQFSCASTTP
jgi:hypothetical protein